MAPRGLKLAINVGDDSPTPRRRPGEVSVHESTTIGIFQQINVALDLVATRRVIAIDDTDFPTDRYAVEGVARLRNCEIRHGLDDLDGVDVVVRSLVDYRTAEVTDLAGETARAAAHGATTVWDLSHAAGALELDLPAANVELAVGCTYKFLNGGPGAPAFVFVAKESSSGWSTDLGWSAQSDQFAMERPFDPRPASEGC